VADSPAPGRLVIACYRPKAGKEQALRALIVDHVPTLRRIGLVTERAPVLMEAKDGTLVEVFEWVSAEAIQSAHRHPAVLRMWEEYGKVCDCVSVAQVAEAAQPFSEFTPFAAPSPRSGRKLATSKAKPA
jgi:hypothetical protein